MVYGDDLKARQWKEVRRFWGNVTFQFHLPLRPTVKADLTDT